MEKRSCHRPVTGDGTHQEPVVSRSNLHFATTTLYPGAMDSPWLAARSRGPQVGLFAGSFDPIHLGHLDVIERVAGTFDALVVAAVSNPDKSSGMFSLSDREMLIARGAYGFVGTIEDLAPKSNSYVFTNVLKDDEDGAHQYDRVRRLAQCRGSLFLSVMLDCDVDEQVQRIDTPDRVARLKGSDPEGYRRHRYSTELFQPPAEEVVRMDTTRVGPRDNAARIYEVLLTRGLRRPGA